MYKKEPEISMITLRGCAAILYFYKNTTRGKNVKFSVQEIFTFISSKLQDGRTSFLMVKSQYRRFAETNGLTILIYI